MNSLDIVILLIMTVTLTISAIRGGVREVFSLAAVIAGFIFASNFYRYAADNVLQLTSHPEVNDLVSIAAIFLFTTILVSFIGGHIAQIVRKSKLKGWDIMAGTAIGALKGLVISCLIVYVLTVFLPRDTAVFKGSYSFPYLSRMASYASPIAPAFFEDEFAKKMGEFGKGPAPALKAPAKQAPAEKSPARRDPEKKPS